MNATYIEQGSNNAIVIEPDGVLPSSYAVDIFQDGVRRITKTSLQCTVSDGAITVPLTETETLSLSPARVGVFVRGSSDGVIYQSDEIPLAIKRSPYRSAYT